MIYPIVKYGQKVLETPAEPVTVFDGDLQKLVADMFETMYAANGVGLAAPQIGDLTLGNPENPPVFHSSGGGVWFGTVHSKGNLPPGNSTARGILFGILGKVEGMQYRIEGDAPSFGVAVYDVQLLDPHGQK